MVPKFTNTLTQYFLQLFWQTIADTVVKQVPKQVWWVLKKKEGPNHVLKHTHLNNVVKMCNNEDLKRKKNKEHEQ